MKTILSGHMNSTMTREYRIIREHGDYAAQLRFDASDDELRVAAILPGWHTFKRSQSQSICCRAIQLAKWENGYKAD